MDPHFDGVIFKTHPAELQRRLRHPRPPLLVIDVRPAGERARGTVPGAVALRAGDLATLPEGTTPATEFFVVGRDQYDEDVRRATNRLRELGARRVVELTGGMFEWESYGFPLAGGSRAA
jgi:rhodanese-related sulfurtransferase